MAAGTVTSQRTPDPMARPGQHGPRWRAGGQPAAQRPLPAGSVSVAMSVYNGASTIDDALATIIEQTHPPDEVVVVDDGSTDATPGHLERATRRWPGLIHVIGYQPNRGTGHALRVASQAVRGEFMFHADADDLYAPRRIEWSLDLFESTGADMVGGQLEDFLGDVRLRRSSFPTDEATRAMHLAAGRDPVAHTTMAVRTSGLTRFGDYRPLRHAEDLELMLRWAHRGARFAVSPELFGTYRMRRAHLSLDRQTSSMLWARYAREIAPLDDADVPTFDTWFVSQSLRPAVREALGRVSRRNLRYLLASIASRGRHPTGGST